jgi:hypothetical protein
MSTTVSTQLIAQTSQYSLFQLQNEGRESAVRHEFNHDGNQIQLLESPAALLRDNNLKLTTRWRNETGPVPVTIYMHLLDQSGQIVAQWDGLDVAWEGWRTGDILWQRHTIPLASDLPAGAYDLRVGLYDPVTGSRWRTAGGADFALINNVEIVP